MSKESLTKLLPLLEAMPGTAVRRPNNIPVAIYLREALKLVALGEKDLAALKSCGYREEMLVDMRERIGALRQAESLWRWRGCAKTGPGFRWDEAVERGFFLRAELLAALRFAYTLQKKSFPFNGILKEKKADELGANLRELAALANANGAALEAINFDMRLTEEAARLAEALSELLLEVEKEREHPARLKWVRDAAFSYLREAVESLRDYARYVFRNDREQRERYASDYLRAKRQRSAKKTAAAGNGAVKNAQEAESLPIIIEESSTNSLVQPVEASKMREQGHSSMAPEGREAAGEPFVKARRVDGESGRPGKRSAGEKVVYDEVKDRCDTELQRFGREKKRCAERRR